MIDTDRARRFYVDVLKLEFVADDGFALVVKTDTSKIRIAKVDKFTPALLRCWARRFPTSPRSSAS